MESKQKLIEELIEVCKQEFDGEASAVLEEALVALLERTTTTKNKPTNEPEIVQEDPLEKKQKEIDVLYNEYVRVNDQNRWMYSLELQKQLCATTMKSSHSIGPSIEEMELALGADHAKFINTMSKLINKLFPPEMTFQSELRGVIQDSKSPSDDLADKLKAYTAQTQKMVDAVNTQIAYLEMLVDARKSQAQKKADANPEEVKAINDLVAELHDMANATQSSEAYELYSDGEIQSTKGGELYGLRSKFQVVNSMTLAPVFKFPLVRGKFTYAILKPEDCAAIRERMTKFAV